MKIKALIENSSPSKDELLDEFYDRVKGMKRSELKLLAKEMAENAWIPRDTNVDETDEHQLRADILEYSKMISDPKQQYDFFEEIVYPVLGIDEIHPPG